MPLELAIMGFAVAALVAIAIRFASRDEAGERRLPAVIDESVGMFAIAGLGRRPMPTDGDAASAEAEADAPRPRPPRVLRQDEIAYRIGVPGAPPADAADALRRLESAPRRPTRSAPVVPIATRPVAGARPMARRGAARCRSSAGSRASSRCSSSCSPRSPRSRCRARPGAGAFGDRHAGLSAAPARQPRRRGDPAARHRRLAADWSARRRSCHRRGSP